MGYGIKRKPKNMGQAIRFFCLECMGGYDEYTDERGNTVPGYLPHGTVRDCPDHNCPLYPYRFGKDPGRSARAKARHAASCSDTSRVISPEQSPEECSRTRRNAPQDKYPTP